MTFPLPFGERRRLFVALCSLAFVGAVAFVVAMLFSAKPSHAEVLALPGSNSGWSVCSYGACRWGDESSPIFPHIIHVPQPISQPDIDAQEQRVKEWEAECGVKFVRDHYGVMRYTYNTPGCEFGSHP
jgi:hypothetical protein